MSLGSPTTALNATELRATIALSGIYALRMLGLFLILPVFALYAEKLPGATPALIGLALGIYGLTQAVMQIPFGMLSDRIGRKPVIIGGLLIFAAGSTIAAASDSIFYIIVGRALQGFGAIAATIMALVADLTREEHRTKAMAILGMSIGSSFILSIVLGPLLNTLIGVSGIFWLTAVLSILAIAVLSISVPTPTITKHHRDTQPVPSQFKSVLKNRDLLRFDFGILVLHMIMTATFMSLPFTLRDHLGIDINDHWQMYLPILLASVVLMVPLIIVGEKFHRMKHILLIAIAMLSAAEVLIFLGYNSVTIVVVAMLLYFIAFNVLEASLPSLVSKIAPAISKGTAMGVFSSSQFFGAFLGGVLGGWVAQRFGTQGVFLFCGGASVAWFLVSCRMSQPKHLLTHMVNVGHLNIDNVSTLCAKLSEVTGVVEAVIIREEGVAYLKVDSQAFDPTSVQQFSVSTI